MQQASIEITRGGDMKLLSVSVVMPTWSKHDEQDNAVSVTIPLFGLRTFTKDESTSDKTIEEAIKCFCIASELYGMGLEEELNTLGWKAKRLTESKTVLVYPKTDTVFDCMMETGEIFTQELEMA